MDDEFFDYGEDDDIEEDDFQDDDGEDDEDQYLHGSSGNQEESSSKDLYKRLQQAEKMAALENNGNLAADEFDVQKMLQFRQQQSASWSGSAKESAAAR